MDNILITGGCGFIGTNFIRYIFEHTNFHGKIINIDKLTYAGNPENLHDIETKFPERYRFIKEDIRNMAAMEKIIDDHQIDVVCHLAAETHVDKSIANPVDFIKTNIIGTYNLLELSKQRNGVISLFHHVSTDEVFGSLGADGYFTEQSPYNPSSPYAASKASSDHLVRAYHKTYGLPITISNCSNNYGPYQFPEKLIPFIILNGLEGNSIQIYGDGKHIRDWLYVDDHSNAIWKIMNKGKVGETYNIGGNSEIRNLEVANIICTIIDDLVGKRPNNISRTKLITLVKDRPGHDRRYAIDFGKITSELGWKPKETFESGIRKTIAWYLNNEKWIKSVKSGHYLSWIKQHYG